MIPANTRTASVLLAAVLVLGACGDTSDRDAAVVAAFVNNEVRALTYRLNINAELRPIHLNTPEGQRVYRRSLCYALAIAADLAARTLVAPAEMPVGLLTSAFGAPFFLWLILRVRHR